VIALGAASGRVFVEKAAGSGVWWKQEGNLLRFAGRSARLYDGPRLLEGTLRDVAGEAHFEVRSSLTALGPRAST
jgi:hypothetical protein